MNHENLNIKRVARTNRKHILQLFKWLSAIYIKNANEIDLRTTASAFERLLVQSCDLNGEPLPHSEDCFVGLINAEVDAIIRFTDFYCDFWIEQERLMKGLSELCTRKALSEVFLQAEEFKSELMKCKAANS